LLLLKNAPQRGSLLLNNEARAEARLKLERDKWSGVVAEITGEATALKEEVTGLAKSLRDLKDGSTPAAVIHIKSTAARLLTLRGSQPRLTAPSSTYFSNPTALTVQKVTAARQTGLLLASVDDAALPSYLDSIVNERTGAIHTNGAALDADVNLCLRMFDLYAMEPAIQHLCYEKELLTDYASSLQQAHLV
jgi:hypothetical protein